MRLVAAKHGWQIEGPGSEHARVAYARVEDDHVVYEIEQPVTHRTGSR